MQNTRTTRVRSWLAMVGVLCLALGVAASPTASAQATDPVVITDVAAVEPVTVESGTSLDEALAALPATTTITASDGSEHEVDLEWSLREFVETSRGDNTVAQEWYPTARGPYEMLGVFDLPEGVVQGEPEVAQEVIAVVTIASGELLSLDDTDQFDEPGTYVAESLTFGDTERTFQYYVPTSYVPGEPIPVMVTLHGAGSYGLGQLFYSEFDRVAEENGFIVVAPDYGLSALGLFLSPGIADFTDAILDHLGEQYTIDERRIYASGISMGGGASVTLAYELSDRIAAIAPVASGISSVLSTDLPRPMTVVSIYGTQDSGWSPVFYDAIERIAELNDADLEPEVTTWPATAEDPTSINRYAYTGGQFGTEAIFYEVVEGGHTWPGKYQYASLISVGLTSQHIDATEMIWEHLSQHSLPAEIGLDIRPRSINLRSRGVTPVAVLSTDTIDATTIDLETVRFGPDQAQPVGYSISDANGDGRSDLKLRFRTQEIGISPDDTSAALTGRAASGGAFSAEDTFRVVPRR